MKLHDALDLPPVVDVATAAAILGVGRNLAYDLINADRWPTPIVRVGRFIKVPTAPLLEFIGLASVTAGGSEGSAEIGGR